MRIRCEKALASHLYSREAELRCGEMGEDDGVRLRMVEEGNELIFDLYSPGDHMTSRVVPPTSGDQARPIAENNRRRERRSCVCDHEPSQETKAGIRMVKQLNSLEIQVRYIRITGRTQSLHRLHRLPNV